MKKSSLIARLRAAGADGIYTRNGATLRTLTVLGWVARGPSANGLTHWRWIRPEEPA